jgi:hypothetical protein
MVAAADTGLRVGTFEGLKLQTRVCAWAHLHGRSCRHGFARGHFCGGKLWGRSYSHAGIVLEQVMDIRGGFGTQVFQYEFLSQTSKLFAKCVLAPNSRMVVLFALLCKFHHFWVGVRHKNIFIYCCCWSAASLTAPRNCYYWKCVVRIQKTVQTHVPQVEMLVATCLKWKRIGPGGAHPEHPECSVYLTEDR